MCPNCLWAEGEQGALIMGQGSNSQTSKRIQLVEHWQQNHLAYEQRYVGCNIKVLQKCSWFICSTDILEQTASDLGYFGG